MADIITFAAEARERAGKGPSRSTRRAGRIPAVIYGNKESPLMISLDPKEVAQQVARRGFFARLLDVKLDGATHRVLPRDVQLDPVTDQPLHVDLMRVGKDTRIRVEVPMQFVNDDKSPGLKRGGVLNIVRRTIELYCSVTNIPEKLIGDLDGLDIGDSLHISKVALPEGVTPTIAGRDFTIASIAVPSAAKAAAEEARAAAEAAASGTGEGAAPAEGAAPGGAPGAAAPAAAGGKGGAAPAAGAAAAGKTAAPAGKGGGSGGGGKKG